MADPITASLVGAVVAGTCTLTAAAVAGTIATANLGYQIGKDIRAKRQKKKEYIENLEKYYKMVDMSLQKLAGLANDMEKAVVMKAESKNSNTFKIWKTRAAEIQVELKDLLDQYEGVSQCRKKKTKFLLSKNMEEKCMEVAGFLEDGKFMIAHF